MPHLPGHNALISQSIVCNDVGIPLGAVFEDAATSVAFDIERLYRRTEPLRATVVALLLLLQAVYLRSFFSRAAYLIRIKLRRVLRL